MVDTVVMAIMGYFQLKARPGAFALQLAHGRSRSLYAVDNSTAGVAPQVSLGSGSGQDSACVWVHVWDVLAFLATRCWPSFQLSDSITKKPNAVRGGQKYGRQRSRGQSCSVSGGTCLALALLGSSRILYCSMMSLRATWQTPITVPGTGCELVTLRHTAVDVGETSDVSPCFGTSCYPRLFEGMASAAGSPNSHGLIKQASTPLQMFSSWRRPARQISHVGVCRDRMERSQFRHWWPSTAWAAGPCSSICTSGQGLSARTCWEGIWMRGKVDTKPPITPVRASVQPLLCLARL